MRFGEDGNAEGFGFVEFGAGVGADDDVVGLFADRAGGFAAVFEDEALELFARARERAGEDEGFPGEACAARGAARLGEAQTVFFETPQQVAVGFFRKKLGDAGGDAQADFGDFGEPFLGGSGEFIH